jgi:hypothetical protein
MKKYLAILLIGIFLLSFLSLAFISAQNEITSDEPYNFFTNLKYKLYKLGLFSAEGQSRSCDVNARHTFYVTKGQTVTNNNFLSYCGSNPSFLIDTFDTSWHFKNEYRSENIGSGLTAGSDGIWELYCCPYHPCSSNSGCSSSPASNYGNTCNSNYGSCYSSTPTHTTTLYNCNTITGSWIQAGTASFGQSRFCSSSSQNNYQSQSGAEGCYSSGPSGWCTQQIVSHYAQGCYDNDLYWYNSQNVREDKKEECGASGCSNNKCNPPVETKGNIHLEDGKSFSYSNQPTYGNVIIKVPLKNYGDAEETINLEAGFYSQSYAQDVAELYASVPLFSSVSIPSCNPNEQFVITKSVTLAPGESQTVEITVDPSKSFITYGSGTHNINSDPLIVFFGLYKTCLGGYINEAGTTGKGIMFDYKEYGRSCPLISSVKIFCGAEQIGTCKSNTLTLSKTCSIPLTTEVVALNEADTNQDGIIDRNELGAYITKWINNQVSREALGSAITIWSGG